MKLQGVYYLLTGAAPLLWMDGFEAVTGDKTDEWLVVMVALLTVSVGAALMFAGEQPVLGIGCAASFAAVDVWVVATGTGTLAYLADAAVELGFIGLWCARVGRHGRQHQRKRKF